MKNIVKKPMYHFLLVLTIASAAGLHGWRTLYNNFAVETAGLDGFHIGIIQSFRELPGFLALCAVFFFYFMREQTLSVFSVIIMGIGIAITGFLPSFSGLLATTLIMSFGFHYYETTNQSLVLQHFDEYQSPLVMGRQRSIMSLVCLIVGTLIFICSKFLSFKVMFLLIGVYVCGAGIWGLFNRPSCLPAKKQTRRFALKKKYAFFYILTLLSGARRQIFMVFSVLLLVKKFGFTVSQITLLFVINNIINYFSAPMVAKAIRRFEEKPVLNTEYISLIIIFTLYAFSTNKWFTASLYILDHITFNGSMAIRTYFQKIADKDDIASSTAVSFTINHAAAIILPAFGGFLWMINYRIPFFMGSAIAVCSLICTQFIKRDQNKASIS